MSSRVATLSVILTILLCPALRSVTGILIAIPLMYFLDIPFNWSVIPALLPSSGFALFRYSPDHLSVFEVTFRLSSVSTWLHGAPSPIRGTLAIFYFVCAIRLSERWDTLQSGILNSWTSASPRAAGPDARRSTSSTTSCMPDKFEPGI